MVTNFPNQPSELTIQILERKSNRPVEDITPHVQATQITERFRTFGTGSIQIRSEDISAESTALILSGNAAVKIIRDSIVVLSTGETTYTDTVTGPITRATLSDGDYIQQTLDFHTVSNEVIVLGNNTGASRNITRVRDTSSQSNIGCREAIVDARQTTTSAERTARGNNTLADMGEFERVITAGGTSQGTFTWLLEFSDNLVYLSYRHIGCTGVANVDPGNVSAGNYIRTILNDNLIIPQSASNDNNAERQIDVPAVIGAYDGIGSTIDLPVRWNNVANVIREACISGSVGLKASVNDSNQIQYDVVTINDRTSGTTNAVIYNRDNADASFNIQVGDKITVEEYIYNDSTVPEIGPVDMLVTGRVINLRRGQTDNIGYQMCGENRTFTDMMRRSQQSTRLAVYA